MERWGDGGAEGHREQVVRREGLMSNERLARPQLILSFHLCFGVSAPPGSTEVITTPSSIILLSLLFTGNCLIICYRFVLRCIILSVICSISCGKHTHAPLPPIPAGPSLRIIVGDTFGMQPESGASFFFFCFVFFLQL